jgi:hypothetical protein
MMSRMCHRMTLAVTTAAAVLLLAACGGSAPAYEVSVSFNAQYTDAAGAAVEDAVHQFDPDAPVLLQTSFPPVAHATVHTNNVSFCDAIRQRLMSRPEIAAVACGAR